MHYLLASSPGEVDGLRCAVNRLQGMVRVSCNQCVIASGCQPYAVGVLGASCLVIGQFNRQLRGAGFVGLLC